jgi:hypothetical protein
MSGAGQKQPTVRGGAVGHAAGLYRASFAWLLRQVRKAEAEIEELQEVERAGTRADTPLIAIIGVILFLIPIVLLVGALSFAAYYLAL